jgi:hypothetical protein
MRRRYTQPNSIVVDLCAQSLDVCIRICSRAVKFLQVSGLPIARNSLFNNPGDIVSLTQTNNSIDSVDMVKNLPPQTLGQAACNHNLLDPSVPSPDRRLLYRLKGLGLRRRYEATGIDDDHVRAFGLAGYQVATLGNLCEHSLTVDYILGTAQCNKTYTNAFSPFLRHKRRD